MPVQYLYRCKGCRQPFTITNQSRVPDCPSCGMTPTRVWSFTHSGSMPEHFNNSLGTWISNRQQFYDGLKIQSEEHSYRLGHDVDYQPIDPSDMADATAHGVTEEGLEATYRANFEAQ